MPDHSCNRLINGEEKLVTEQPKPGIPHSIGRQGDGFKRSKRGLGLVILVTPLD